MVKAALKRPITILVLFIGLLLFSIMSLRTVPIDIFPSLNSPTVYVIQQYGGMSAKQMEGFFSTKMQDHFLYVDGLKNIESKNTQGLTLIKLSFYEGTDMAEASAEIAIQVNRCLAFFPPGSLPPEVVRFDASSVPVGELVFSSKTKSLNDVFDMASTIIRPLFGKIPGLSAPPAFGSNARSIIIKADPEKLRELNISPEQVVEALGRNNAITPSGNVRIDSTMYVSSVNSQEEHVKDFNDIPIVSNGVNTIYVKDVAHVEDASDIVMDYALVNGKRSVYFPIVKTASSSTWDVVQNLRKEIPEMQSLLPKDVHISYEFDQSVFVMNSAKSLMTEGILGAVLTGLMVLLFLRDWRSSLVVVITIPVAILSTVFCLKMAGQTINMMTLSGLALAIGILVDQATVTIENIHQHFEMGKTKKQAIQDACMEISFPLLLILLCILAVFAPSFVMTGVPKAMFLPLSLSIAFAMIISYIAAQTLVPIISNWLLKEEMFQYHHNQPHAHAGLDLNSEETDEINKHTAEDIKHPEENDFFQRIKVGLLHKLNNWMPKRKPIVVFYLVVVLLLTGVGFVTIGKDMLPHSNAGQLQLRVREPDGTRLEITERNVKSILSIIDSAVHGNVAITSAFVGPVSSNFGHSNLYVFNSGTHEAVLQVELDEKYKVNMDDLKDQIRLDIKKKFPRVKLSFEPIELTEKLMSQGSATPIEVRVAAKDMDNLADYSNKLVKRLQQIPYLRDVQIAQPLKFPTINVHLDRQKLAQLGLSVENVSKSISDVTASSRYTLKNLWLDNQKQYTYNTEVQVPEYMMNSLDQLKSTPVVAGKMRPVLSDVASITIDSLPGEYDRSGPRRFLTINANIYKKDLGTATTDVQKAVDEMGTPPSGLVAQVRGMSSLLTETLGSLQSGLLAAIVVILLLLTANYQSVGLAFSILSTVPAVLFGSIGMLLLTGSTLNLQSYMGIIMSVGVSVSNAILIVNNAESLRLEYRDPFKAASVAASIRLRPILMTSLAMIAGMIPMASGLGESGDQSAPLGRAVIGGLITSTIAALYIVPLVYGWIQQNASYKDVSLLAETEKKQNMN
ncbi:efflux RND transporter permease subunit [Pedobacter sp. L105]|uniref:efflux RND transporter permease subunit n=1 Tax=Pedobacter sp. L105 TaxID=1641871 RepID=UPI001C203AD2|nr:efflux RND transporter permease subunit [Pedobacter sp. L105]